MKLQKLCDLFVLRAKPLGEACSEKEDASRLVLSLKHSALGAFILPFFPSGLSKMKVYVKFRVHAEEKRNFTNSFFSLMHGSLPRLETKESQANTGDGVDHHL